MKKFTKQEILELYGQVTLGEISFSRMVEIMNEMVSDANEPQYKDGDFVVNMNGSILIFKEKVGDFIYYHAYLTAGLFLIISAPTQAPIERCATEAEKQALLDALAKKGKRWNEEKKCIEDIPKRKFKVGDKVVLKSGLAESIYFGRYVGRKITVEGYTNSGYVYSNDCIYCFPEEYLEPYEELKEGDLAIFWNGDKRDAAIRIYERFNGGEYFTHRDHQGINWKNAIRYKSKEQYEKLIKGEI